MADLVKVQGLRLYLYPDGHGNLAGPDGEGYPFASLAEFGESILHLLRRLEMEARRGR